MSGQGSKEIKYTHERIPLAKLKIVNCLTSNVKQNYMERNIYVKELGGCLLMTLQKISIKTTSFEDET